MPNPDVSSDQAPLRVVVCDDHPTISLAVSQVFQRATDGPAIEPVGCHATSESLLASWRPGLADVVVLDMSLGGGTDEHGGLALARRLRDVDPGTRVLFYSGVADASVVRRALEEGACGYVDKTVSPHELVAAVRRVAAGERPVLDAATATRLAIQVMDHKDHVALSPREHEVLGQVAAGRTNIQIASQLSITENSVKTLLRRALGKLGTPDRASAVAEGFRRGLLQ